MRHITIARTSHRATHMKIRIRECVYTGFGLLILILLSGCERGPVELTIFHTNDIHAHYGRSEASWLPDNPLIGGFDALAEELGKQRRSVEHSLLLDAGDILSGTPVSDMIRNGVRGGNLIHMMNLLKYDAMCVGNHEFDLSVNNLYAMARMAHFPILAANLYDMNGNPFLGPGWTILKRGPLRVGIIGLITDSLYGISSSEVANRIDVRVGIDVVDSLTKVLDPRCDLIILLSHSGYSADRTMARKLGDRIDVIIGGHSHDRIDPPEVINGVIVTQAGAKLRHLGRLDIQVKDDEVIGHSGKIILLDGDKTLERFGNTLAPIVDSLDAVVTAAYGDTIGYSTTDLYRSYFEESNIGNWVADAVRVYTGADVAFVNSGGLRADFRRGPLTRRDIKELLPFDNSIAVFTCSGEQLTAIMRNNALAAVQESHGILQVSGIRCLYEAIEGDKIRIKSLQVDDEDVEPDRIYECATVDFVASSNPTKYLGFKPAHVYDYQLAIGELAIRTLENTERITSTIEGRFVQSENHRKDRS